MSETPADGDGKTSDDGAPVPSHRSAAVRGGVAIVLIALVATGLWRLSDRPGTDQPLVRPQASTSAPGDPAGSREALAVAALQRQDDALRTGSRARYLASWDSGATPSQHRAQTTYANLRALGIAGLTPRYVSADAGLSSSEQDRLGGDGWTAEVEVRFAIRGFDRRPARTTVRYTFVLRDGQGRIVDVGAAAGERRPIWSFGRLEVRRTSRTLVAAAGAPSADRVSQALVQAVRDVEAVLPAWSGTLVAYVPATTTDLESVLAAAPGSYDEIAAVTTTVDGSTGAATPVAVVINAGVFGRLGAIGSHVVVTHEATHVATGAAMVTMPLWVAEGFADYVGVGAVDVPLRISARAVVTDVRRNGPPEALPGPGAFDAGGAGLELAYEQAWLANRVLASTYGERALVDFYEAVVERPHRLTPAFRDLGTTRPAFTARWRDHLTALAS